MDDLISVGRSLPLYAILPATAAFVGLLVVLMARIHNAPARFLVFAIWLRFLMSAYHTITYDPSPIGLTWNAIGSSLITGLGLLLIRRRPLLHPLLVPFYLLGGLMLLSAAINMTLGGAIDAVVKYAYLVVLMLATLDAAEDLGPDRLLTYLIWPFAVPFTLQAISIALGISKVERLSGAVSYIGGFDHEAAFSLALVAGVLVVALNGSLRLWLKFLLIGVGTAGIILANYRTAILAMVPLVGVAMLISLSRVFVARQRTVIGAFVAVGVLAAALVGGMRMEQRFSDIDVAITRSAQLMKPKSDYTPEERRILSGRPVIWSGYVYGWYRANDVRKLVGFGPDSWMGAFRLYAHNTLISTLYELGILGVIVMLFVWVWMLLWALRAAIEARALLIAAHLSFILLNMATMPLWLIEGTIYYAILCGVMGYYVWTPERARVPGLPLRARLDPALDAPLLLWPRKRRVIPPQSAR